ncbi:TPA: hypothetical protein F7063_10650, partial [Legionella pneumophila]|nr:hypothetical protein [Legionella pneumophila]
MITPFTKLCSVIHCVSSANSGVESAKTIAKMDDLTNIFITHSLHKSISVMQLKNIVHYNYKLFLLLNDFLGVTTWTRNKLNNGKT